MDEWRYNLDQGIQIDVIYTDFEKAFDKVPHQGLISKLEAYNLDSTLLLWIQSINQSIKFYYFSSTLQARFHLHTLQPQTAHTSRLSV